MDYFCSNGPHIDRAIFLWRGLSSVVYRRTVQRGSVCKDGDGRMVCAVWHAFTHSGNAYLNDRETPYKGPHIDRRGAPDSNYIRRSVDARFWILANVPSGFRNLLRPQNPYRRRHGLTTGQSQAVT